ncbi:hypothetical protein SAMN05216286_1335 [Kosakonia oryzae]|uniref:Uncharacterized protein n=1 Tax=Kosakonia oryzae TaxID=497725 RepID=A0AA94KP45_9ENTR|nr:hypothetical protein SAMN05216286_1335 [Kosakonia oryzae]
MKGNTKKTEMFGFGAYWARLFETRQKPLQLQSSRQDGGTGMNSPEEKHMHHLRRKVNRTGGVPRGRMNKKMYRLGWRSESRKDLNRATQ